MWNYLSGQCTLRITGRRAESFIDAASRCGVRMARARRTSGESVVVCISPRDFKKLRPIAKSTSCRIKIIKKSGAPFFINALKFRVPLLICAALALLVIIAASQFIFKVEIMGCSNIPKSDIEQKLEALGVAELSLKTSIEPSSIAAALMNSDENIAWAGVSISGVVLRVEIVEADLPPKLVQDEGSGDIVAAFDGIITQIVALSGHAAVQVGDAVKKGDVLISGSIGTQDKPISVRARGSVTAKSPMVLTRTVGERALKLVDTGRSTRSLRVGLLGHEFQKNCEFMYYRTVHTGDYSLHNCLLPLSIRAFSHFELEYREALLYDSERLSLAMRLVNNMLANTDIVNAVILSQKSEAALGKNEAWAKLTLTVLRDIGEYRESAAP